MPRIRITFHLTCGRGEDPAVKSREIALEQTVELPEQCLDPDIERRIVGRVEAVEPMDDGRWRSVLSFDPATVGGELTQLLNLLFGNISLKTGIRIAAIDWPEPWLARFRGPLHGIDGLRRLCGTDDRRPLLCTALKPLGLRPAELARLCERFAAAGVDIIKDDHGLADQEFAPFADRVRSCQDAVERANGRRQGRSLYFPNLTCEPSHLDERLQQVRDAGCSGVLIGPLLSGPGAVRHVADRGGLAVMSHPALAGAFFHDDHGIAPEVLLGEVFRVAGSDAVIYPNVGGRFPFDERTCLDVAAKLRGKLGTLAPAFPVPAGGIDVRRVPHWVERYGPDTVFLIGGSLYSRPDPERAAAQVLEALSR